MKVFEAVVRIDTKERIGDAGAWSDVTRCDVLIIAARPVMEFGDLKTLRNGEINAIAGQNGNSSSRMNLVTRFGQHGRKLGRNWEVDV
jgi:hypothetical protein